jgi:hypothetical protein
VGRTELRIGWIPEKEQTGREAGHVIPSCDEHKNEGICTCTLSLVFMACTWTVVLYGKLMLYPYLYHHFRTDGFYNRKSDKRD